MRTLIVLAAMRTLIVLAAMCTPAVAAPVPKELRKAPSDPAQRAEVPADESENHRKMGEILRRFWFNDQPSRLTPERIHGGIL